MKKGLLSDLFPRVPLFKVARDLIQSLGKIGKGGQQSTHFGPSLVLQKSGQRIEGKFLYTLHLLRIQKRKKESERK